MTDVKTLTELDPLDAADAWFYAWLIGAGTDPDTQWKVPASLLLGGGGGASVTVSGTTPATPADGDLWFDTSLTPDALKVYVAAIPGWELAGAVGSTLRYFVELEFREAPLGGEELGRHIAGNDFIIPANFASPNSYGSIGTNPAATYVITVKRNGTTIGTITISTAGVVTWATTSGTAKTILAGETITFHGQATADGGISYCSFTVVGQG